jgi:uncharacterized PurR-regulated membrane protein YhhQ (DUF165 family)
MHSVIAQPFDAPQEDLSKRIWWIVRAILRLIFPVVTLFSILMIALIFAKDTVYVFDIFPNHLWAWNPSYWLSAGHLMLPIAFFVVNITNRKYGATYAYGQVIITWVLLAVATLYLMAAFGDWKTDNPFPPLQTSVAFLAAFGVAQIFNVSVFDRTRGRTWWGAPLISLLWASLVYVVIFHPVANWGLDQVWMPKMVTDLSLKWVSALILLVPYHFLRKSIRPMPGYGGA